jgi:hypothetical protein
MNKLILVIYVNISNIQSTESIHSYLSEMTKVIGQQDNGIIHYIFPVTDSPTRVECINPKLVLEDEYQTAKHILDDNEKKVMNFIENYSIKESVE